MPESAPVLSFAPAPLLREMTRAWAPPRGSSILAAVSGGADSIALLHLLAGLAPGRGWSVIVASLDHGLRADAGAADVAFVRDVAGRLGLPFVGGTADARPGRGQSPEEAARAARHGFLRGAADAAGATCVALGHTADDQAETVLFRLGRGTGLAGAAAMRRWSAPWWRPLLATRREVLRRFITNAGREWREDETNASNGPMRNRIRHELMPAFERCLGPGAVDALVRGAGLSGDDADYLDALSAAAEPGVLRAEAPGRVELDRRAVRDLPPAVSRRILRAYCARVSRCHLSVGAAHVAALEALVRGDTSGTRADLNRGLTAERKGNALILTSSTREAEAE